MKSQGLTLEYLLDHSSAIRRRNRPLITKRLCLDTFSVEFGRYSGKTRGALPHWYRSQKVGILSMRQSFLKNGVTNVIHEHALAPRDPNQGQEEYIPSGTRRVRVKAHGTSLIDVILYTDFYAVGRYETCHVSRPTCDQEVALRQTGTTASPPHRREKRRLKPSLRRTQKRL